MKAYKVYLRDPARNCFEHVGVLPERRRTVDRTADESIVNWARKYFGKSFQDGDIFVVETVLKDSEKEFFLPLSDHV